VSNKAKFNVLTSKVLKTPVHSFTDKPIARGWNFDGPLRYRISTPIINETSSTFQAFAFNPEMMAIGVSSKQDMLFTGQVFSSSTNGKYYRISDLLAHITSVDCYSVIEVPIEKLVHDINVKNRGPLASISDYVNGKCSVSSKSAGCHLSINWNEMKNGQDPMLGGAKPISVLDGAVKLFMGAYTSGEIGFDARLSLISTSKVEVYVQFDAIAQIGFVLNNSIHEDEVSIKEFCYPIPHLGYETKIFGQEFAIGVLLCGQLVIRDIDFTSSTILQYIRTFRASYKKTVSITTKGFRNPDAEKSFQSILDSNIGVDSIEKFINNATLKLTPELQIYAKIAITLAGTDLVDFR
jgi:hypothetical protein